MNILYHPPGFIARVFSSLIWRMEHDTQNVYLTFDDGPIPEVTCEILSILKQFQSKATFFCVGNNVNRHPEIYNQILTEGHQTGNHTFSHLNGWKSDAKKYLDDIEEAATLIKSNLFRPPHGKITPKQLKFLKKKYQIVMWSTLSGDFNTNLSPEDCYKNVINHTKTGSIIVFHDSIKSKKNVLESLPKVLNYFNSKGFKTDKTLPSGLT